MSEMTLEQFQERLKALLCEAEDAGLDLDDVCAIVEHTLETFGDGK